MAAALTAVNITGPQIPSPSPRPSFQLAPAQKVPVTLFDKLATAAFVPVNILPALAVVPILADMTFAFPNLAMPGALAPVTIAG